jgi:hypothetical protein
VGAEDQEAVRTAAADNVKRIVKGNGDQSPYEVTNLMEMKTVWHTKGV